MGFLDDTVQSMRDSINGSVAKVNPMQPVVNALSTPPPDEAAQARAVGQSALQDAIKRGMQTNDTPSGNVQAIPGTKLGE
jgi:hypothetical protein